MEDNQNGKRPKWKMTKMEDNQNGRRAKMEYYENGSPKWKMAKQNEEEQNGNEMG